MRSICVVALYLCAALQFVRYYTVSTPVYINMHQYMGGTERLPFQDRVLPLYALRCISLGLHRLHLAVNPAGAFTAERAALFILALVSFVVAALFTQVLYALASKRRRLPALVFPAFLFTMMWTYSIHTEANFAYPYDFPSVAFFAAGLVGIYARKYWLLAAIVAIGTANRETTLFLVVMYALDGLLSAPPRVERASNRPASLWIRATVLFALWLAVKFFIAHRYAANDRSEDYIRIAENLGRLKPRLWPALLNICGYALPIVLLFLNRLYPVRFRRLLFILPVWFGVMFAKGVIVETRIFGELCPLIAVALVLLIEETAQPRGEGSPLVSSIADSGCACLGPRTSKLT